MNRTDDLKVLTEGKPFIRSVLAFLIYLRFGRTEIKNTPMCYAQADDFINQLEKDLSQ